MSSRRFAFTKSQLKSVIDLAKNKFSEVKNVFCVTLSILILLILRIFLTNIRKLKCSFVYYRLDVFSI